MLSCFPLTLWITLSFSPLLVFLLGTSERQRAPTLSSWTSSMHLDLFFIFMHSFDNLMLSYRYIYIITILYYIKIYTLGSIIMSKASGGDGIPVELFQILKDDAVKVMHSICQQIWKTQQWPQDWKRSVFIPIPKKGNAKECSNYHTIALISHTSKVMLKILQARLQQYLNRELPDVQADFRKGRGTRDQIANIFWIIKKARKFQKNTSISALLTIPKPLTVWITINCGKFRKRWEYQTT